MTWNLHKNSPQSHLIWQKAEQGEDSGRLEKEEEPPGLIFQVIQ